MTTSDFKILLDRVFEPINNRLERIEEELVGVNGRLNDSDTGLIAINNRMDANTGAVVELESIIKAYGDMYKINDSNSRKLEKRIEILEDKSGIIPPPEFTMVEIA